MYGFFYGTFTHVSTNNLDSAMISTFHAGGSSPQTNAVECSIAHTPWKKKNKLKRRQERREKPDRMKKEARL